MKKNIVFLIFITLVPAFVLATTQGTWDMPNAADEVFKIDGTTPLDSGSIWQLIWSPDDTISSFNPLNPFEVDGTETVLLEIANPNGSYVQFINFEDLTDSYVGGHVYTRAFDYTGPTSGFNPVDLDGMMYVESGFSGPLEKIDGVPAGDPFEHEPFVGPTIVDQTYSIPEPSTIVFMVLGFVGLLGCRKKLR